MSDIQARIDQLHGNLATDMHEWLNRVEKSIPYRVIPTRAAQWMDAYDARRNLYLLHTLGYTGEPAEALTEAYRCIYAACAILGLDAESVIDPNREPAAPPTPFADVESLQL